MPLGTEIGLGPGDIVLDGDPAPPPRNVGKKHSSPSPFFGPLCSSTVDHLSNCPVLVLFWFPAVD